jgi:putative transposase
LFLQRREGDPSGINRIYRLYREEGLTVREHSGRRFRVLNIVDDVTRECLAAIPDTSISGHRVAYPAPRGVTQTAEARIAAG